MERSTSGCRSPQLLKGRLRTATVARGEWTRKETDMTLGKPIAIGRTAEVYAWGQDQVLKLFHDWFSEDGVHYEARIARAVHGVGLPVPGVGEIVRVDGRLGLEYERLRGIDMFELMAARPWRILGQARLLADLHARVHAIRGIEGLPSQREKLARKIETARGLSVTLRQAALQALNEAPQDDRLCHGDFHPGNVMLTDRGPVVIDWIDATLGDARSDVARTTVLIEGERAAGALLSRAERLLLGWAHRAYVRRYFQIRPGGRELCHVWQPIVAAGRMNEGIEELENWLRAKVEAGLGPVGTEDRHHPDQLGQL
jgi:uncharacterized protein (TIGR02172 family)